MELAPPVTAQNRFGLALLQQLTGQQPHANVFVSPLGVAMALHLALDGAAGATRAAIASTLQVSALPAADLDAALAAQLHKLLHPAENEPVLTLATAVWADQPFVLAPAYAARLQQHYQAEAATLDFAAPEAAATINDWVSKHTQGKITQVVAGPLPSPLLLANAVYFRGKWLAEFDPAATGPGAFTLADGTRRQVPLMRQRSTELGYQAGPGWQAVRLPYQGYHQRFSLQVFVPDLPTGLPAFLAALTAESWVAWQVAFASGQAPVAVDLTLPRFRLDWEQNLTPTLATLGLGPALHEGADFTDMGFPAEAGGFIGSIVHKTYLAVDEVSTEAAAVTVTMMAGGMPPPPPRLVTVRADHPFFCAIVDDATGALLFGGVVYEPAPLETGGFAAQ